MSSSTQEKLPSKPCVIRGVKLTQRPGAVGFAFSDTAAPPRGQGQPQPRKWVLPFAVGGGAGAEVRSQTCYVELRAESTRTLHGNAGSHLANFIHEGTAV